MQAEYRAYVLTTDWIASVSEVAVVTGISMVATPYMAYGSGYLWTAGGTGGRIVVGTVGAGAVSYGLYDAYTIVHDWNTMKWHERFRRVGDLAGPTVVGFGFGPRYFTLGRNAAKQKIPFWSSWDRVTPPSHRSAKVQTIRVFTATEEPVNLSWPGTGEINNQTGLPTPSGAGGTFVVKEFDITNPVALSTHIQRSLPPGIFPKYVAEIEVPTQGLRPDPTGDVRPCHGWIAPDTPGAKIVRLWKIRWYYDPSVGYEVPVFIEVPVGKIPNRGR